MAKKPERSAHTLNRIVIALLCLTVCATARAAGAGDETGVKEARSGAGLRVGSWQVQNIVKPASGSDTGSPAVEAWFQKGLDVHLTMENTIGFWQRDRTSNESGSLGSQTRRESQGYLVPVLTSVKLFPATAPSRAFEPFLTAGLGAVLGIDREKVTSNDPLVQAGETTEFRTGLGIQTGAGIEWHSRGAYGLTVGGRYQWASFSDPVADMRLYRGPGVNVGLTYRFKYE